MEMKNVSYTSLFSGFWLWIILIQDGADGIDLLDAIIKYVGQL